MMVRQWLFRMRAEALLAEIKSLNVNRNSCTEAQRFMTRWGSWGQWYGNCSKEDCSYSVRIYHLSLVYPAFVFEEGPHFSARTLELLGLRSAAVTARFDIVHGVVTNKGFGMSVALPVSKWIAPGDSFWLMEKNGGAYWPSLDVASFEGIKLRGATRFGITRHPNRGFIQRRTTLEASFTPEEALAEQIALMDFHFDCITRWVACSNVEELLPKAGEEFRADIAAEQ